MQTGAKPPDLRPLDWHGCGDAPKCSSRAGEGVAAAAPMVAGYSVQGDLFLTDKPRLWSEKKLAITPATREYDVAPDGKRVVAIMPVEGPEEQKAQHHVIFLLNFFDELRRRVPPGGNSTH